MAVEQQRVLTQMTPERLRKKAALELVVSTKPLQERRAKLVRETLRKEAEDRLQKVADHGKYLKLLRDENNGNSGVGR